MTSSPRTGDRVPGRPAALCPVDPAEVRASVRGALDLEPTPDGFSCHRLPRWTRRQYPDPAIGALAAHGSGVRLELATTATAVELDLRLTRVRTDGDPAPLRPAVVSATLDGRELPPLSLDEGDLWVVGPGARWHVERGAPSTARFTLPPTGRAGDAERRLEIWLPHNCAAEVRELRADGSTRAAPPTGPRWIHYGSSISHCMDAESPLRVWPVAAARRLGLDLVNLGLAGQAQLDPFVARTIRDTDAELITLKLGINVLNTGAFNRRTFGPAVHGFLDTVREGHPRTPIVVVSPIHCADRQTADGGPTSGAWRLTLADVRRTLREATAAPGSGAAPAAAAAEEERARRPPEPAHHRTPAAPGREQGAPEPVRAPARPARVVPAREPERVLLRHLDGRLLLGPDDARHLRDGLHPDDHGYALMARRFAALAAGWGVV